MSSIVDFKQAMAAANAAVILKVKGKADAAFLADNALKLGGQTKDQLVATASNAVAVHAANKNNPHGVSAATIGAYTKAEIDALLTKSIPSGFLPITRFGTPSGGGSDQPPSHYRLNNPPRIVISATVAMLNGSTYSLPETTLAVAANTSAFVYFCLTNGVPGYKSASSYNPETSTSTYIGSTISSATAVTFSSLLAVTRLGLYRVSTAAFGSSIPVSQGNPANPAALGWT